MKRNYILGFLLGFLSASAALAAQSPIGKWKTTDEKTGKVTSDVEIYDQAGILYGKIVDVVDPVDKNGKPPVCTACAGNDKNKPILGLIILRDFKPNGDRYQGTILDPRDGKIYNGEIWVEDGTLKVRGYVGFIYQTRTWLKAT